MKIETLLAIWGSVTGTVACAHLLYGWFHDRGRLKAQGTMSVDHGDRLSVILSIHAVNVGRRPVRISRVAALISKESMPVPPGTSPERIAEMRKHLVSSEISPLGNAGKSIELSPDGGQHTWEIVLPRNPGFQSFTKRGEKVGKGYVLLTSGKKAFFTFPLLEGDVWNQVAEWRANA